MFTAKQAYDKSKHSAKIQELKKKIEKEIIQATEEGRFKCGITMSVDTEVYVRQEIQNWLEGLGYRVNMPGVLDQSDVPLDQQSYWQDITIKW